MQTIQQNVGYNQSLNIRPLGGSIKLSANTTCISSLNVSEITILSNNVVIGGSNADNILQIGKSGWLELGSGTTVYH